MLILLCLNWIDLSLASQLSIFENYQYIDLKTFVHFCLMSKLEELISFIVKHLSLLIFILNNWIIKLIILTQECCLLHFSDYMRVFDAYLLNSKFFIFISCFSIAFFVLISFNLSHLILNQSHCNRSDHR